MYEVKILDEAIKELKTLNSAIAKRIISKIYWIAENFDTINPESLTGELSSFFKLRVGDYRVLYDVNSDTKTIFIHLIGHRKDIYK